MSKVVLLSVLVVLCYCKVEYHNTKRLSKINKEIIAQEAKKRSKRGFTIVPTTSIIAIHTDTWGVRGEL